jgi:hypothetical protein
VWILCFLEFVRNNGTEASHSLKIISTRLMILKFGFRVVVCWTCVAARRSLKKAGGDFRRWDRSPSNEPHLKPDDRMKKQNCSGLTELPWSGRNDGKRAFSTQSTLENVFYFQSFGFPRRKDL